MGRRRVRLRSELTAGESLLGGFGSSVRVLAPDDVIDGLRNVARELAMLYP